mmetsp:Transcript_34975/g.100739  ORF Transcript_34975/g.100739 Transcript_34975/m.100739 type:complete len:244 (-) Transcript_34975:118-849(-)
MAVVAMPGCDLPTLLRSRAPPAADDLRKLCRRPAPLLLDESALEACGLRIRNTFLDVEVPGSVAGKERILQTCPSRRVGGMSLDVAVPDTEEASPVALPTSSWAETPCGFEGAPQRSPQQLVWRQSPLAEAGGARKLKLQLAEALCPRPPSPRVPPPSLAPQPATPPPPGFAPGSPELPSLGSAGHAEGSCKPCAFVHAGRCANGPMCSFCHLCGPDERKLRRRAKLEAMRAKRSEGGQVSPR